MYMYKFICHMYKFCILFWELMDSWRSLNLLQVHGSQLKSLQGTGKEVSWLWEERQVDQEEDIQSSFILFFPQSWHY